MGTEKGPVDPKYYFHARLLPHLAVPAPLQPLVILRAVEDHRSLSSLLNSDGFAVESRGRPVQGPTNSAGLGGRLDPEKTNASGWIGRCLTAEVGWSRALITITGPARN